MGVTRKKYETNNGSIFYVEFDDTASVVTFAGAEPEGSAIETLTVYAGKNKNKNGIRARQVLLARLIGTAGKTSDGYTTSARAYKRIPILTKSVWSGKVIGSIGDEGVDTVVTGTVTWTAVKLIDEDVD